MAEVTRRLRTRFSDVGAEVIDAMVAELHAEFDGDPIRDFVAVLVERQAADRLGARRESPTAAPPGADPVPVRGRPGRPVMSPG